MQFNTYIYALAFLPITAIGYFLINRFNYSAAKIFLVAASALFYIYAGIEGFKWLVISMAVNYILTLLLKKRKSKWILWVGILAKRHNRLITCIANRNQFLYFSADWISCRYLSGRNN